jgi:flagellar P-ring protein precursor FlgI
MHHVKKSATLQDLVKSLNALGASSEDLISIFQALKKNGALIGDIELL